MGRVLSFIFFLVGSLVHGQAQTIPVNGQELSGLNQYSQQVLNLMNQYGVPGATLTLMQGDRIVLAKGYGWADREGQVEMQPDALFRIPYLDTIITSAATLRLIEQGTLSMGTQVFPLLSDLPPLDGATEDPRLASITIRHLLEGTSGLGVPENNFYFRDLVRQYSQDAGLPSPISCEEMIRVIRGKKLAASPGSTQVDSITEMCVLAAVIEHVSGMSYEEYVRAQIFQPLGITTPVPARTFRKDQPPREVRYYTESTDLVPSIFDDGPAMVPAPYGAIPWETMKDVWAISSVDYCRIIASLSGYGPGILNSPITTSVRYVPTYGNGFYWYWYGDKFGILVGTASTDGYTATLFMNYTPTNKDPLIGSIVAVARSIESDPPFPSGSLTSQFLHPPEVPQAEIEISSDIAGTQPIASFGTLVLPTAGPATVMLDGRSSMAGAGSIKAYEWRVNGEVIGTTSSLNYDLTAMENSITLRVTNTAGRQHAVSATVKLAGNMPLVSSVNAAGGGATIAANTWIEIKGSNLAPASLPDAGVTWSNEPEFAQGMMPTRLSDVSVTVNGQPSYTYFVSRNQVNVLTGLMPATGQVEIIVTTPEGSSDPFMAQFADLAPAFFQIGSGNIAATHLDGSLIGPADLFPGYTTGIAQGETIVLYANGFGQPGAALTEGSAVQTGALPQLPVVKFGGVAGTVTFAGVIAPGLYQFNVEPPPGLSGPVEVIAEYQGVMTPSGAMLYFAE